MTGKVTITPRRIELTTEIRHFKEMTGGFKQGDTLVIDGVEQTVSVAEETEVITLTKRGTLIVQSKYLTHAEGQRRVLTQQPSTETHYQGTMGHIVLSQIYDELTGGRK
jgi:hypothetical protein